MTATAGARALAIAAIVVAAVALLAPGAPPAAAQPGAAPDERPWAAGVSEAEQAIALGFYDQGNAEFVQDHFVQALAHYRRAIEHWDHPAIRFNMVECLINLDQLVAARESLELALAHGAAPLGDEFHRQALTYRKLLDGQLTHVTVRCREGGADVSLDGRHMFTAPGEESRFLLPGDHQIVATKPGFLAATERLELAAGTRRDVDVRLIVFEPAPVMTRRWPRWKPLAVMAGGAVVAAAGALALVAADRTFDAYDADVRAICPTGCTAEHAATLTELSRDRRRGEVVRTGGQVLLAAGGAAIAAGVLGLYLGRLRPSAGERPAPVVAPVVAPVTGGATVGVGWRF